MPFGRVSKGKINHSSRPDRSSAILVSSASCFYLAVYVRTSMRMSGRHLHTVLLRGAKLLRSWLCGDFGCVLLHVPNFLQRDSIFGQAATSRAAAPPSTLSCLLLSCALKTSSPVMAAGPVNVKSALSPQLDGQQVAGGCTRFTSVHSSLPMPRRTGDSIGRDSRQILCESQGVPSTASRSIICLKG